MRVEEKKSRLKGNEIMNNNKKDKIRLFVRWIEERRAKEKKEWRSGIANKK